GADPGCEVGIVDLDLDLAAMLAAGDVEIQVNDPTFAPQVGALFDGAQEPLIRTNNVNPLVLEIAPRSPIRLRSVRAMFAASRYDWVLEAAPGAPRLLAPEVPEWEWSSIEPPEGEPTSRVRLEILRLERDDYVHVSELELWVDPEP
ncbi:MAG TPA: hypothetical protein VMS76_08075, partial [Planctomycetota bacterium]|nr:hypothetical protein [Planctomycetota bacterium]